MKYKWHQFLISSLYVGLCQLPPHSTFGKWPQYYVPIMQDLRIFKNGFDDCSVSSGCLEEKKTLLSHSEGPNRWNCQLFMRVAKLKQIQATQRQNKYISLKNERILW